MNTAKPLPPRDVVRSALSYDAESGVFRWARRTAYRIKVGEVAGCVAPDGYRRIRLGGIRYPAHRLAWLYQIGEEPALCHVIDHKNGQRDDNRIENLRVVLHAVNMENQRRARRGSASGLLGVTLAHNGGKPFVARISSGGRIRHLGAFDTAAEASAAYIAAKRSLHVGCSI